MKKERKRGWNLHNSGYDEPIYKNYRDAITLQNSRMVKTTSFIGSVIMIILTLVALFVSSVSKVLPLYLFTASMFIAIFLVARIAGTKSNTVVLICNYAFLTVAFIFALGLDVIQRNATATTVCVCSWLLCRCLLWTSHFVSFLFSLSLVFALCMSRCILSNRPKLPLMY